MKKTTMEAIGVVVFTLALLALAVSVGLPVLLLFLKYVMVPYVHWVTMWLP